MQHEVEGRYICEYISVKTRKRDPFAAVGIEESTVLRLTLKEYKENFYSCGKRRVV
jgi:hypothetical protein